MRNMIEGGGCNCSRYRERYHCKKNTCSKRKEEGVNYCWEHKNCCQYDKGYKSCESKATTADRYCEDHREKCSYCSERKHIKNGYCENHRCRECGITVSSGKGYCSNHVNSCPHCSKRISEYNERCDRCIQKYKCKYSYCPVIVYPSEWSYCIDHKYECQVGSSCPKRLRNYGEYCEDHKKECEFDRCDRRVNNYNSHCSIHPPQEQARLYKGERDSFQAQLNTANVNLTATNNRLTTKQQEVNWLQGQLRMEMSDAEYQARIETNYPPQFRN